MITAVKQVRCRAFAPPTDARCPAHTRVAREDRL